MNIPMKNAAKAANEAVTKILDKLSEEMDNEGMDWIVVERFRDYRVEVYPDGTCDLIREAEDEKPEEGKGDDPARYSLKLECRNCGHQWDQEIPVGMDFFPFGLGNMYWEACYAHPRPSNGHKPNYLPNPVECRIACPKCGSFRVDRAKENKDGR